MSCVNNDTLVSAVMMCNHQDSICVYTYGGHKDYHMVGNLNIFPIPVFVNPDSMANILSLQDVSKKFRVTMDTSEEMSMLVHHDPGKAYKFNSCGNGLFHMNMKDPQVVPVKVNNIVNPYSFLSTVASNKEYFTLAEIEGADEARDLQHLINWPADQYLIDQLKNNRIRNCPILPEDV